MYLLFWYRSMHEKNGCWSI